MTKLGRGFRHDDPARLPRSGTPSVLGTLCRSLLSAGSSLASSVTLARGLGASMYGHFQVIASVAAQIGQLCECGVGTAVIAADQSRQRGFLGPFLIRFFVVAGLLATISTWLVLSILIDPSDTTQVAAGTGIAVASVGHFLVVGQLRLAGMTAWANLVLLIPPLSHALTCILLLWIGSLTATNALISLMVATTVAAVVGGGIAWRGSRMRATDERHPSSDSSSESRNLLRLSWRASMARISQLLIYRLDFLLLALLCNDTAVGIYAPAVFFVAQLNQIGDASAFVLFPAVANREADSLTACRASRCIVIATGLAGLAMALLCGFVFRVIWGNEYTGAVYPFLILLPGYLLHTPARALSAFLNVKTQFRSTLFASLIALSINIVLNVALIPRFGINGAAAATTFALIGSTLVLSREFTRTTNHRWHQYWIPRKSDFQMMLTGLK